jgi:hypothetical protein
MSVITPFSLRSTCFSQMSGFSPGSPLLESNIVKNALYHTLEEMGSAFFGKDRLEEVCNREMEIKARSGVVDLPGEYIQMVWNLLRNESFFLNTFFHTTTNEEYPLSQMNLSNIRKQIYDLSIDQQKDLLKKAVDRGLSGIIKIIVNNPQFVSREYGFCVVCLAKAGLLSDLHYFLYHPIGEGIEINGENSLMSALCEASQQGRPEIISELLAYPGAGKISVNGSNSLSQSIYEAAVSGQKEYLIGDPVGVLNLLLAHPSAEGLGVVGRYSFR